VTASTRGCVNASDRPLRTARIRDGLAIILSEGNRPSARGGEDVAKGTSMRKEKKKPKKKK